jgi:predicted transcriptional regulator YdeE
MKHELVTYPGFQIIGIATQIPRGNSPEEMGALWQRFFQENIWDKIPNKDSTEIICLYTHYEGGYDDPMTAILGTKVTASAKAPEDLISHTIATGQYIRFVGKGAIPDIVAETWHKIWSSDVEPAFTHTFEVYAGNQDPKNAQIDVYIAV